MDFKIHIHDVYNLEGGDVLSFNAETKDNISKWLKEYVQALVDAEDNFVIDKFKHLFVANNYAEELFEFQKEKGLNQGYTKNEIAEGFAMALSYKNHDGVEERAIFYKAEIIFGMYYKNDNTDAELRDNKWMPFNIFFHELCHINDDYQIKKHIDLDEVKKYSVIPRYVYPISFSLWQEYYAYRKSAERFPYGDLMISHLEEAEEWAFNEVVKLTKKYREDNNTSECMMKFTNIMEYLLRVMVSVAGNVYGYQAETNNRQELFDFVLDELKYEGIKTIFNRLAKELDKLFIEYPTWNGLSRLGILSDIVLDCFNAFGVYPSEVENDQMYINFK
jgi:hypothetical protein